MKKIFYTAFLFFLLARNNGLAAPIIFEGTDITEAVEYFRPMVHPLKSSVYVYHWNAGGTRGDSPLVYQQVEKWSKSFWQSYGNPETAIGGMYGRGLYTAIDPVYSFSFGGGPENWFLLELELPVGFKLLDIAAQSFVGEGGLTKTDILKSIEAKFKCINLAYVDSLFTEGGYKITPECQSLTRKIFQEVLQIDGFSYGYGNSKFKDCNPDIDLVTNRAIVVTNPNWLTPNLAKYFTKKSTHSIESRIRIQTLFYKKVEGVVLLSENSQKLIADYLDAHLDKELMGSKSICTDATCVINLTFCDKENKQCEVLALDPLPRPSGPNITEKSASNTEPHTLLWPDLEGKPKDQNISVWINKNLFGCSGSLPYAIEAANPNK